MIEVRGARSVLEVEGAIAVLDSVLGPTRGYQNKRDAFLDLYRSEPDLLSLALVEGDRCVGAVGCDGVSTVETVAVVEEYRRRGLARRLLQRAEDVLRSRGAASAGLGSLDGAVDFYLASGYIPQLLVQFAPEAEDPESIIGVLLSTVLRGRQVVRRRWQDHPQLWLQERSIDWELKHEIEGVGAGVVAQYIMSKPL